MNLCRSRIAIAVLSLFLPFYQAIAGYTQTPYTCSRSDWSDCVEGMGAYFSDPSWTIVSTGLVKQISESRSSSFTTITETTTMGCKASRTVDGVYQEFTGSGPGNCVYSYYFFNTDDAVVGNGPLNDNPIRQCGSIIDVNSLALSEVIPIPGTGEVIAYNSSRTPAYLPNYQINFDKLYMDNNTSSIDHVRLTIGDRIISWDYSQIVGNSHIYTWDGNDSNGNPVPSAVATLDYYKNGGGIGSLGTVTKILFGSNVPGRTYSNFIGVSVGAAQQLVVPLGSLNPKFFGLGGWTFGSVHFYDDARKRIYYGNGEFRNAVVIEKHLSTSGEINDNESTGSTPVYVVAHSYLDEAYVFEKASGRHLHTYSTLTGKILETITYDGNGRIASIVDDKSNTTSFSYPSSTTVTITAPFGQQTTLELNASGQLVKVTSPAGKEHEMTYQSASSDLLTTFETPNGAVATFTYDSDGLLATDYNTNGNKWDITNTYNPASNTKQVSMTTAEGINYSYQTIYDKGNRKEFVYSYSPSGASTQTSRDYDGGGHKSLADGTYIYYSSGTDPRFSTQKEHYSSYSQSTRNSVTSFNQYQSISTTTNPDKFLDVSSQTDTITLNGDNYITSFDGATNKFTHTTPESRVSTTTIDDYNRITEYQFDQFLPITYNYNTNGLLSKITQGTRESEYFYNTDGRLDEIQNPLNQSTHFEYYTDGELKKQTFHDGREVNFTYDSAGRLASITPPGRPAHGFLPNLFNKISQYLAPVLPGLTDTLTTYDYDDDGKLTEVNAPGALTINYYYNLTTGFLEEVATPEGSHYVSYNNRDEIDTISSPDGITLDFEFYSDVVGQKIQSDSNTIATIDNTFNEYLLASQSININDTLNSQTLQSSVSFGYDNDRLLTSAGDLTLSRDSDTGLIDGTTLDNITETFTYDPNYGELASYEAKYLSTTLYSETYTRDSLGRVDEKTVYQNGVTKTIDYVYDNVGRLYEVYVNGTLYHRYIYDLNSNRTGRVKLVGGLEVTESATFDDQDRILTFENTTYSYENNGDRDQSITTGGDTIDTNYDSQGSLASYSHTHTGGTDLYTFKNDSFGQRVETIKNSLVQSRFVYNSQRQVIAEITPAGELVHYIYATQSHSPDYIIKNGTKYKLVKDQIGSIRLVVNSSNGTIVDSTEYDEFGVKLSSTSPGFISIGFAGGIEDLATGLVRFGARDYDPNLGRWTAKDPINFRGEDSNIYNYVHNDPVNYIDPDGKSWRLVGQFLAGTAALLLMREAIVNSGLWEKFKESEWGKKIKEKYDNLFGEQNQNPTGFGNVNTKEPLRLPSSVEDQSNSKELKGPPEVPACP